VVRTRTVAPLQVADVPQWDDEADVLVVGFGCAGASAAWEAATAGADVLVLERASGSGGTSALSGGELYLGGGTNVQTACGIEDDPTEMAAFLRAALGPGVDEEKLTAYCEGSVEHCSWLEQLGVPFTPGLYDDPSWMPPTDDGLMWLGERTWPFTEVAKPAPRGHRPATGHFGGWLLMDKLAAATRAAGAREAFDVYAERLVIDVDSVDGDRVVGIQARQYGETRSYRARHAVVLTTGGFVDDDGMLAEHAPRLLPMDKISCGGEDGSGIRMAQALGAAVRHMGASQVGFHAVPAFMARGVVVNSRGQRFINEDTYPGRIGQAALFAQGMDCWVILDETGYEQVPKGERWGVLPHETAETLEELEQLTGLPEGSLVATIGEYNRHAANGQDPVCHKDPRWLRPLDPPFAAIDPKRSFRGPNDPPVGSGAAVFTLGGLATDVAGRVLHVDGTPIPGLLAAGRVSSGLAAWGYISGTSLGDGTFFGRFAGRTASATVQPNPHRDTDRSQHG
jgi:3-oxo-5alpha-steroid 4-dehydrogenase